jgi:hypothetical protein
VEPDAVGSDVAVPPRSVDQDVADAGAGHLS